MGHQPEKPVRMSEAEYLEFESQSNIRHEFICGDLQFALNRTDTITNPTLIVEVLSPSTALEDRNAKWDEYRALASLQDYLLVSVDEVKVEVFSRQKSGKWLYEAVKGLDASVHVPSLDCTLSLTEIYEQVPVDAPDENLNTSP